MTDTTDTEVHTQAALPGLELPEHYGRPAVAQATKLTGSGKRVLGEHEVGSRVVFLVEGRCASAGTFKTDADGNLDYSETFTITDLFEVHGPAGMRLLSSMRQAYRTSDDDVDAEGRQRVDGAHGVTDESGVMMTATEVAQLRGDPVAAAFDKRMAPVVVVYSDGAREMWPEEFESMTPRPEAGEVFHAHDGSEVVVSQILDAVTGEKIGVWTDDQERERLDAAEADDEGSDDDAG